MPKTFAPLLVIVFAGIVMPASAADPLERDDLRNRVDKLTAKPGKLTKGKLKRFYAVKYKDDEVVAARHQCYLALVDQVNLRGENRKRQKELKFIRKELKKLRKGYGKLAGLSASQVEACEERRTPECEKLVNLQDNHKTRYFRSEIDIMRDEARGVEEAISAHERMTERAFEQCRSKLNSLG